MKNYTWILLILALVACGQKSVLSIADASQQFCDCFNSKMTGSVDERLSPCLQEIGDKKNDEWNSEGLTDPDSIKNKLSDFSLAVMLDMIGTCDDYFIAMNGLYDNGYPIDTTQLNRDAVRELSIKIKTETNRDSLKSLLHRKSYKLIRSRVLIWHYKLLTQLNHWTVMTTTQVLQVPTSLINRDIMTKH
jgi:cbb3-type cytochrome oxidase cytochrome c subunit